MLDPAKVLGTETEERFFNAVRTLQRPVWFYGVRRARTVEDHNGYDAFATIDIGEVPIQIKRSYFGAEKYMRRYPGREIVLMVVTPGMVEEAIQSKALFLLEKWRETKLAEMQWPKAWWPLLNSRVARSA